MGKDGKKIFQKVSKSGSPVLTQNKFYNITAFILIKPNLTHFLVGTSV
jgi:hypothetical protein